MTREIPASVAPFSKPTLIDGEALEDFEHLRSLLIDDVDPQTNIEWLWLFDLAELTWEVLRYRRLKVRILSIYRGKAIEALLLRVDGPCAVAQGNQFFQLQARRSAADWQMDIEAAAEIEGRLARSGFDIESINAEVFVQARDAIALFDALANNAQARRNALLREISLSRSWSCSPRFKANEVLARRRRLPAP